MKTNFLISVLATAMIGSCTHKADEYVDLSTGKTVYLVKDSTTGYMVNKETHKAVYLYVNPTTHDTFYGRTGAKVNGEIRLSDDKVYLYNGDDDFTYKEGEFKPKATGDGTLKAGDEDVKVKVQSDGDIIIKKGDYKKKIETNGDVKIKNGDTKIKIKDGKKKIKQG